MTARRRDDRSRGEEGGSVAIQDEEWEMGAGEAEGRMERMLFVVGEGMERVLTRFVCYVSESSWYQWS